MTRRRKIVLGVVLVIVLAMVATIALFRLRPLEVLAWFQRRALAHAGLEQTTVNTPVGPQVLWQGGSGQPLVFLHGAGDQAGTWSKVAPAFLSDHRVLVLDLPGHGASAPQEGPLSFSTVVEGTASVLNTLPADQPAILVGNSMGAWVAFLYAFRHPGRVARIVAVDGGPLQGESSDIPLTPKNREQARRLISVLRDPSSPPIPDWVLDDVIRNARDGAMGRLLADPQTFVTHLLDESQLHGMTTPVDLLWGESDKLMPVSYAQRLQAALPAARLTLVPHCGHVPQVECPERFLQALQEVLQKPAPAPAPEANSTAKP